MNTKLVLICSILVGFILYLLFVLSCWFLFKKEEIEQNKALMPFVNFFYYFKICKIPFWTFFIPGINIIVLICAVYKLALDYGLKKYLCFLALVIPYIILLYISLSDKTRGKKRAKIIPIKTVEEIDKLEEKMIDEIDFDESSLYNQNRVENIASDFHSTTEEMIESIEQNNVIDDIFFLDSVVPEESTEEIKITEPADDLIEIFDTPIESLTTSNVQQLEEKMIIENNIKRIDNAEYKEYELDGPTKESIAFGNGDQINDIKKAKVENLKCTRCGSSLIGATGTCPGCGIKI